MISPDNYLGVDEPILSFLGQRQVLPNELFPQGDLTELLVRYVDPTISDEWLPMAAIRKQLIESFKKAPIKTFPFTFDKSFLMQIYGLNKDSF